MRKIFLILLLICVVFNVAAQINFYDEKEINQLYYDFNLNEDILEYDAFYQALHGYNLINPANKKYVCIIDYTKSSKEKRFFVFDLVKKEILYYTYVSHGRNSGNEYALNFSNETGSYKSSLGFFLTESTYQGRNGYSLVLNGLEKGINNNAKNRAIVIHGANYVTSSKQFPLQRLGRSHGCPALAVSEAKEIIDRLKNGALIYIYAQNANYQRESSYVNSRFLRASVDFRLR
ncbi:MAG: murein L,D-transpeptidase catalytic domain family protein [Bacteroidales bacterium]|jgi:hypothetical protein|nr:murein L,D-transpeptidase catalytic domain family protein [Bacteroidales bacterium]